MSDDEWYDDLDFEEADEVFQRIAAAQGNLESALETLDGRGGRHRDKLAEAFGLVSYEKTSFNGARKLKAREENE